MVCFWWDVPCASTLTSIVFAHARGTQVVVPPGGVFRWGKGQLEVKGQKTAVDGWQQVGAIQHDNWGAPAFFHRYVGEGLQ